MAQLDIAHNYTPYVSNSPILDSRGVLHHAGNIKKKSDEVVIQEREDKEKKRLLTLQSNREAKAKQAEEKPKEKPKEKAKEKPKKQPKTKKQPKVKVKEVKKKPVHNIPTGLKEKYKLSLKENNLSVKGRVTLTRFARLYGRGDYNQGIIFWVEYISKVRDELFQARERSTRIRLKEIHGYYTLSRARQNPPEKILPRNVRSWQRITRQLLEKPKVSMGGKTTNEIKG